MSRTWRSLRHQRPAVPGIRSTFGTGTELLNSLRLMYSRLANHRCPNGHYLAPTLAVAAGKQLTCPVCGKKFFAPSAEELAFNSQGACPACGGTGIVRAVDRSTLVPDENLTIEGGAVAPWNSLMWSLMVDVCRAMGVRTDVPFRELTQKEKEIVFDGPPEKKHILYYSKNPEALHGEFIGACLGAPTPVSFKAQKEAFQEILTGTLGEECEYEIVRQIHENLTEMAEEHKEDTEPLALGKSQVRELLEKSGVEPERMERFDQVYEETAGENTAILVPAIAGTGKFAVKTPDVDIRVNPDRLDLVETRLVEGRKCLVIAVEDNIEVNGVPVTIWADKNGH